MCVPLGVEFCQKNMAWNSVLKIESINLLTFSHTLLDFTTAHASISNYLPVFEKLDYTYLLRK